MYQISRNSIKQSDRAIALSEIDGEVFIHVDLNPIINVNLYHQYATHINVTDRGKIKLKEYSVRQILLAVEREGNI